MNPTTRNRKITLAGVKAAESVIALLLMLLPIVLSLWVTNAVWLVLFALAEFALAGCAVVYIRGRARRALCAQGHTPEQITVDTGGAG